MKGSFFTLAILALGLMGPALANPQPPYSTTTTVVEWGGKGPESEFKVRGTLLPQTLIRGQGFVNTFTINGYNVLGWGQQGRATPVPTGKPCEFTLLPSMTEVLRHPSVGGYETERIDWYTIQGVVCPPS